MFAKLKSLHNHTGFIRYFKNTSWMMGEQFLRIIAGLFVGIWVARYLGPEQFGLFSYVLAFTSIFGGIAKLGLDGILVRELVNHPEKRETYLGTAFWLKVSGAFIAMSLMALILPFTSNDATTNLFIFIIAAVLVFQSFEVVELYFQSQVLAKMVSICKVNQLALSSVIKIYLVLTEAELIWFVLVTAFDVIFLAISYFIAYHFKNNLSFYKHFDLSIAKQLLKDSWPLIFSAIVVMIYMRIDQIMIKEMLGEYEVGIYSAAVRVSEAFYVIPVVVMASLFPAILNARKQNEKLYKQRLQRLYTLMVWFAIAIALPMTFLSEPLIILLFGQAYQEAGHVLMIHAWALIFIFLMMSSGRWFIAEGFQLLALARNFSACLINIVLNLFLIPSHGIQGAAIATLISFFLSGYLFDCFTKKTRRQFFLKTKTILMAIK